MADEKITVEWIGTATKMTQVLDRLEAKLDKQEKQLKKIGVTGKKSGTEAATQSGSVIARHTGIGGGERQF